MRVKIKTLVPNLPLPRYQTPGSVAFDIAASASLTIPPRQVRLVNTGLVIKVPKGHFLLIAARSSLAVKKGLALANGLGIIDEDYCGEDDESRIILYNLTNRPVKIKQGDKLAQGIFVPYRKASWQKVKKMGRPSRGGIGSTGGYQC